MDGLDMEMRRTGGSVGNLGIIAARNVCDALPRGVSLLMKTGQREQSRAGPVLVAPGPVITITWLPTERVLFSAVRDANPFFHLVESIWMLAGRGDAATLNHYVGDFGERFAENGGVIHGAYGHRWRRALGFDQLDHVVETLRRDPTSRQCVIQMWDATEGGAAYGDGGYHQHDLRGEWKDRPCNTHVDLRVRETPSAQVTALGSELMMTVPVLDLTVCCRSNDAIWGAHGANAVHFSVLQEYLAARIGVGVGTMYQWSNNYHAYESELENLTRRAARIAKRETDQATLSAHLVDDRYDRAYVKPMSMFTAGQYVDEDVRRFFNWHDSMEAWPYRPDLKKQPDHVNRWFEVVLERACLAHWYWRNSRGAATAGLEKTAEAHRRDAVATAALIEDAAWSIACREWIERRVR